MAESDDRQVWHLPERPGSARTLRTASARSLDRARPGDSAASRSAAPATPLPAPLPSAPRTASPAPPHPAPSSLHERKWESQRRGPAETKHRGGRGGAAAGGKAPEPGRPRGPALPASPRPHSPAPESVPCPSPALQSRLGTAAARAPGTASLGVSRAAPASSSVRSRGPSRGIGAKEPQPLSRLPGTPGSGTTTPSRLSDTNARDNGGSRGTNAPKPLCFTRSFYPTLHPPPNPQGSGR